MDETSYIKLLETRVKDLENYNTDLIEMMKRIPLLNNTPPNVVESSSNENENNENDPRIFEPVRKRTELPSEKRDRLQRESYARMKAKLKQKAAESNP